MSRGAVNKCMYGGKRQVVLSMYIFLSHPSLRNCFVLGTYKYKVWNRIM